MNAKLTVVTTLYHSANYIKNFYNRLKATIDTLNFEYEIIFVNDGSPDSSAEIVLELQKTDPHIILVDLSRNFGHHQAIFTGLQCAKGEYVFLIDCDLEEDPELLTTFWNEFQKTKDVDVVFGIQQKRKGKFFERISGDLFYRLLGYLTKVQYPSNTLTARLMTRKYVNAVLDFKEKVLDIWSVFVLTGFHQVGIPVAKKDKGNSTYTLSKKVAMGIEIITSLSHRPLYIIFVIGTVWLFISSANVFFILVNKWFYASSPEGWTSIMASVWLIGGIVIFFLGVIGIYLSKIFVEIKGRPLSIIRKIYKRN